MESSLSSSCKRAKAGAVAVVGQAAQCLVDGCDADLSVCRDYHRRHKVCEAHSKTPKVSIGGREQRFCQQCSRFHSLVEFDEGKRSCRKRLDGHNRRRRKPQPQPPDSSSTTQHAAALQGTLVSFTSPHNSSCWGAGADHDNMLLYNTTTQLQLQLQLQHHNHNHNHNHNYYINNAERSPQSSFHLQNHDYSCDAALSLLSVPPPIPNLHYPAFPAPAPAPAPATHHHGSATAASHHTRTFTWDH